MKVKYLKCNDDDDNSLINKYSFLRNSYGSPEKDYLIVFICTTIREYELEHFDDD